MIQFNKLSSSRRALQAFTLTAARFIGVILGFAISLINTHFLDTEEYGQLQFIRRLLLIFPVFLNLGVPYSIGRLVACQKYENRVIQLITSSFAVFGVLSLCATLILLAFSICVNSLFETNIKFLVLCVSPFAFIYFYKMLISNVLQGQNRIYSYSAWQILHQLSYVLISLIIIWQFDFSLSVSLSIIVISGTVITILGLTC